MSFKGSFCKKIAALVFCLAAAIPMASSAEWIVPTHIGAHLYTHHTDDGKSAQGSTGWNNNNYGLYMRWANGLTIGHYKNSLYSPSTYAGWTAETGSGRLAVTVGVVSGYDKVVDSGGDYTATRCGDTCRQVSLKKVITPLVVPSVYLPIATQAGIRLSLIAPPGTALAIHLSVEIGL